MDDARGKRRRLLGSLRFEFVTSRPAPAGASPGGILPRGIPLRSPNASRGCPMRARALASSHRSRVCDGGADRAPFSRALDKHHYSAPARSRGRRTRTRTNRGKFATLGHHTEPAHRRSDRKLVAAPQSRAGQHPDETRARLRGARRGGSRSRVLVVVVRVDDDDSTSPNNHRVVGGGERARGRVLDADDVAPPRDRARGAARRSARRARDVVVDDDDARGRAVERAPLVVVVVVADDDGDARVLPMSRARAPREGLPEGDVRVRADVVGRRRRRGGPARVPRRHRVERRAAQGSAQGEREGGTEEGAGEAREAKGAPSAIRALRFDLPPAAAVLPRPRSVVRPSVRRVASLFRVMNQYWHQPETIWFHGGRPRVERNSFPRLAPRSA